MEDPARHICRLLCPLGYGDMRKYMKHDQALLQYHPTFLWAKVIGRIALYGLTLQRHQLLPSRPTHRKHGIFCLVTITLYGD